MTAVTLPPERQETPMSELPPQAAEVEASTDQPSTDTSLTETGLNVDQERAINRVVEGFKQLGLDEGYLDIIRYKLENGFKTDSPDGHHGSLYQAISIEDATAALVQIKGIRENFFSSVTDETFLNSPDREQVIQEVFNAFFAHGFGTGGLAHFSSLDANTDYWPRFSEDLSNPELHHSFLYLSGLLEEKNAIASSALIEDHQKLFEKSFSSRYMLEILQLLKQQDFDLHGIKDQRIEENETVRNAARPASLPSDNPMSLEFAASAGTLTSRDKALASNYTAPFVSPIDTEKYDAAVTSRFSGGDNLRLHPYWGDYREHLGVDIGSYDNGVPIRSIGNGIVENVEFHSRQQGGAGWIVEIRHEDGSLAQYLHLEENSIDVQVGDFVTAGTEIGTMGMSGGVSTGEHLDVRLIAESDAVAKTLRDYGLDPQMIASRQRYYVDLGQLINKGFQIENNKAW